MATIAELKIECREYMAGGASSQFNQDVSDILNLLASPFQEDYDLGLEQAADLKVRLLVYLNANLFRGITNKATDAQKLTFLNELAGMNFVSSNSPDLGMVDYQLFK